MRKLLSLVMALLPLVSYAQFRTPDYSEMNDSDVVSSLKEHVAYISSPSMRGRALGSEGEAESAVYFADVLKSYGVDLISTEEGETFGLKQENGDTLTSHNVLGFIPGYDKSLRDHYIVIGARLDNVGTCKLTVDGESTEIIYPGANGNASGLATLLELSKMLSTNAIMLRRSVIIAAFGASSCSFAGAWYFLNRSFPDAGNIDAMIDLDMLGNGSAGFYGYSCSNPDMNAIAEALKGTLQPVQPTIISSEPFPSDNMAFYDKGIPSMLFTTGLFPEYRTPKDDFSIVDFESMESQLEYIYNYTVSLANGPKPIFNAAAEISKQDSQTGTIPYYDCDRKPTFLGNSDPRFFLQKWVYQYLKYPQSAVDQGVQGKVLVDFVIDEKGGITDAKVLRSVDPRLDEEALRVINASPKWKPGYVRGKPVRSELSLYIEFRLEKKHR